MAIYQLALKNVSRPHSAVPTNCVSLFFFFFKDRETWSERQCNFPKTLFNFTLGSWAMMDLV